MGPRRREWSQAVTEAHLGRCHATRVVRACGSMCPCVPEVRLPAPCEQEVVQQTPRVKVCPRTPGCPAVLSAQCVGVGGGLCVGTGCCLSVVRGTFSVLCAPWIQIPGPGVLRRGNLTDGNTFAGVSVSYINGIWAWSEPRAPYSTCGSLLPQLDQGRSYCPWRHGLAVGWSLWQPWNLREEPCQGRET